ncbi:MAG: PD40 domain-containing protein [Spirochaetes bacterium]|nr:PD40 domain-containing protein [Spirochaetota bacterium]
MGIKKINRIIFLILSGLMLAACDNDYEGLQYVSALQESFNGTGKGKSIPLTVEKAVELDGTITNNGAYICFTSDRENGNFDVYLRQLNNIETVRLTTHSANDYSPAISPNGKYVAFVSNRDDPEGDIFYARIRPKDIFKLKKSVLNKSLTVENSIHNLTQVKKPDGGFDSIKDANPVWSPDTGRLVFSSTRGDGYTENLWMCQRDGKNMHQLTFKGGMYPGFSQDGKKIVFISYRDSGSNGDIYIYDIVTGTETRITEGSGIELNPSFAGGSDRIIYTSISEDTNGNKELDLKDRSDLYFFDIARNQKYKLLFNDYSVFSARYFPALKTKYENSRVLNFSGVIIYAEQNGQDINLSMVPEYGIIPKRLNASQQLKLADDYTEENVPFEQLLASYMRVYYFFGKSGNPDDRTAVLNSLRKYAVYMKKTGKNSGIREVISLINSNDNLNEDPYSEIVVKYASALLSGISDGEKYLQNLFIEKSENISMQPKVYQALAEHYSLFGENKKSAEMYLKLLNSYPDISDRNQIIFSYVVNSGKFDEKYFTLLTVPGYRNRLEYFIVKEIENGNFNADNFPSAAEGENKHFLQNIKNFNEAVVNFNKGNYRQAKTFFAGLGESGSKSIISYKSDVYLYEIEKREKNYLKAYSILGRAMLKYDAQWSDPNYTGYVEMLIDYYEETGLNFENNNQITEANELYKNYAALIDKFKNNDNLSGLYDKYGARSQILLIDTYIKRYPGKMDKLIDLENEYLKSLNSARKNYDKVHIYGLAYIYLNKALLLDYYYKNDNLKLLGNYSTKDIASNISSCIEQLDWSLFMDDYFIDAYMLKNWTNQYIEVRKREEQESGGSLYSRLNRNFSSMLLEGNISSYQKAIEKNNEKLKPEEEGNLYLNLGNTYFLINNYLKAAECYKSAEKFKTAFTSQKEEALFYFHYAYSYWQLGNVKQAREEIDKSYQIYSFLSKGNKMQANADKMINLLRFYSLFESLNNNYKRAIEIYKEIINIAITHKVKIDFSMYELDIAYCYKQMGLYDEAFPYLNSAAARLSKKKNNDAKYYLKVKFLGLGPFSVYNLGPDAAAFGNTRLFAPLSNYEKQLFMYSIIEDIYLADNDFDKALEILTTKEKASRRKDTILTRDIRVRSLNNIGYLNFRKSDFEESEKYFKEAMKLASDEKTLDLDGYFMSVNNLANLYQYISENRIKILDNPESSFDSLISDIQKYRNNYEKNRYDEERKSLEASLKAEKKKITEEDRIRIREEVSIEAEKIYFRIDLILANLNFYKTNIQEKNTLLSGDAAKIYASNKSIYDSYIFSKKIYENINENYSDQIDQYSRIKVILNLAEINEQSAFYERAYSYYGEAEKLAEQYDMNDMLVDIYFKQAVFLSQHYKNLNLKENAAESYFSAGDKLVSFFPPLYYENLSKISNYYREYAFYLADRNSAQKSFQSLEYSKKLLILKALIDQSSENGEKLLMQSLKDDLHKYRTNLKQITDRKIKAADDQEILKLKKINNDIVSREIKNFRNSKISYLIEKNLNNNNFKNPAFTCEFNRNRLYIYSIKGNDFKVAVSKLNPASSISSQMSDRLQLKLSEEKFSTLIMNEFLMDNFEIDNEKYLNLSFNSAFLTDFISGSNEDIYSDSVSILDKPFNSLSDEEIQRAETASVLCDNDTPVVIFSNLIQKNIVSPSFVLKRITPKTGFQDVLYLAFSSYYAGIKGTMVYYSLKTLPVKNNLPDFVKDEISLHKINTYADKNGKYINFGTSGDFITEIQKTEDNVYLKEMNLRIEKGNFKQAAASLQRWNNMKTEKVYGEYEYYSSLILEKEKEYLKALKVLEKVKLKDVLDEELQKKIYSLEIYLNLVTDNFPAAEDIILKSDVSGVNETEFYADLISFVNSAGNVPEVPLKTVFDRNELILLNLKFIHVVKGRPAASAELKKTGISIRNLAEKDQLYLVRLSQGSLKFNGKDLALQNLDEETNFKNISGWRIDRENPDAADIFKVMKMADESLKNQNYIFMKNMMEETDFSGIQSSDNILDVSVFLSELFTTLADINENEVTVGLYKKIKDNRLLFKSFPVPYLISRIINEITMYDNPFFSSLLSDYEKKVKPESTLMRNVTEMKLISAVKENNYREVRKLISDKDENYFSVKGIYHFSGIFYDLDGSQKNADKLAFAGSSFLSKISFLNDKSAVQKYIADSIIENFISANNRLQNYSYALSFSALKKQIDFHYFENFRIGYVSEAVYSEILKNGGDQFYRSVSSLKIADLLVKKLNDKSVILNFEKSGNDILIYKISSSGIEFYSLDKKYQIIPDIYSRYQEILKKQEDTLIISQELRDLFSPVFENFGNFDKVYIVHDKFLKDLPYELIKTDSILENDYNVYYLASLKNGLISPAGTKRTIKIAQDQILFENRLLSIVLRETGMKIDNNSENLHYMNKLKFNRFTGQFENGFISSLSGTKFLILNENFEQLPENRISDICNYRNTDYVLISSPYVRDVNIPFFYRNFYQEFNNSGDVKSAFSAALKTTGNTPRYKNAVNWEKIRLYVNGI